MELKYTLLIMYVTCAVVTTLVMSQTNESESRATCNCGTGRSAFDKIVGGTETAVAEYPWLTALLYQGSYFFCGGSLINDRFVVTAAHCLEEYSSTDITVRLLEHDFDRTDESNHIDLDVKRFIIHKKYKPTTISQENDIALLELSSPIDLGTSTGIIPICLPSKKAKHKKDEAVVAGWGKLSETGPISSTLQHVTVKTMTTKKCQKKSSYPPDTITKNMICAKKHQKDACQGDSGGPLMVPRKSDGRYELAGVVSFGIGCAQSQYPGVYTRISRYVRWISKKTKSAIWCST